MGSRTDLISERYLSADKMNLIYADFTVLKEALEGKGYSVGELQDSSVSYGIYPENILAKMNAVESNIRTIEAATDWINPYYEEFKWRHNTRDKRVQVDRWINYLNFAHGAISGGTPGEQKLADITGRGITDKNLNRITVLKEDK